MSPSHRHTSAFFLVMMLAGAIAVAGPACAEETDPACLLPQSGEEDSSSVIYRLTVSPAGEPVPALRYRFLVPAAEQIRANAAIFYYKAILSGGNDWLKNFNADERLDGWLAEQPANLPLETIKSLLAPATRPIFQSAMRAASRADHCDWGDGELGENIPRLELEHCRQLALALCVLTKAQLAEHRADDARETVAWGYALSRHLGSAPNFVTAPTGWSIASIMQSATCDLIGHADAPNLYWALTEVAGQSPARADGFEGRRLWEEIFPKLAELDRRVFADDEIIELVHRLAANTLIRVEANPWDAKDDVALLSTTLSLLPDARTYLQRHGYAAERLDKMPLLQQVTLYRWRQFIELEQNTAKWTLLPERDGRNRSLRNAARELDRQGDSGKPFDMMVIPNAGGLRAVLRKEREIDLLRAIEALRMYAAREGHWPRHAGRRNGRADSNRRSDRRTVRLLGQRRFGDALRPAACLS